MRPIVVGVDLPRRRRTVQPTQLDITYINDQRDIPVWKTYQDWLAAHPRPARYVLPLLLLLVASMVVLLFLLFRSAWQSGRDAQIGVAIGIVMSLPVVFAIDRSARRARDSRR